MAQEVDLLLEESRFRDLKHDFVSREPRECVVQQGLVLLPRAYGDNQQVIAIYLAAAHGRRGLARHVITLRGRTRVGERSLVGKWGNDRVHPALEFEATGFQPHGQHAEAITALEDGDRERQVFAIAGVDRDLKEPVASIGFAVPNGALDALQPRFLLQPGDLVEQFFRGGCWIMIVGQRPIECPAIEAKPQLRGAWLRGKEDGAIHPGAVVRFNQSVAEHVLDRLS